MPAAGAQGHLLPLGAPGLWDGHARTQRLAGHPTSARLRYLASSERSALPSVIECLARRGTPHRFIGRPDETLVQRSEAQRARLWVELGGGYLIGPLSPTSYPTSCKACADASLMSRCHRQRRDQRTGAR